MSTAVFFPPDPQWRRVLAEAIPPELLVTWAPTAEEAMARAADRQCQLFLCDSTVALRDGGRVPEFLRSLPNPPRLILVCGPEVEDQFHILVQYGISVVLPRIELPSRETLNVTLRSLLNPSESLGLGKHLPPETPVESRRIVSMNDKQQTVEEICAAVAKLKHNPFAAFDVRLVLEEMLNNALMHAFLTRDGHGRYNIAHFVSLGPDERLEVQFGFGRQVIGFAVIDNRGRLRVGDILERLRRQFSMEGVADETGRGLFLVWALATSLVVTVLPGEVTQVVALFDLSNPLGEKSLCLFEKGRR